MSLWGQEWILSLGLKDEFCLIVNPVLPVNAYPYSRHTWKPTTKINGILNIRMRRHCIAWCQIVNGLYTIKAFCTFSFKSWQPVKYTSPCSSWTCYPKLNLFDKSRNWKYMAETNPNSRLEAFCDGVFAIALTLLIIDIKIPSTTEIHTNAEFWLALKHMLPSIFAFILSFVIILISWVNHHASLKIGQ